MDINDRRAMLAFFNAVAAWGLDEAEAAALAGVESATVADWRADRALPSSEEILARMTMVALIDTALDIYFSSQLSNKWMKLANSGAPYRGLSPVAYVGEHGWPGLFWILRQVQAWAVGN